MNGSASDPVCHPAPQPPELVPDRPTLTPAKLVLTRDKLSLTLDRLSLTSGKLDLTASALHLTCNNFVLAPDKLALTSGKLSLTPAKLDLAPHKLVLAPAATPLTGHRAPFPPGPSLPSSAPASPPAARAPLARSRMPLPADATADDLLASQLAVQPSAANRSDSGDLSVSESNRLLDNSPQGKAERNQFKKSDNTRCLPATHSTFAITDTLCVCVDPISLTFRTLAPSFYFAYKTARASVDLAGPGEPTPPEPPVNP